MQQTSASSLTSQVPLTLEDIQNALDLLTICANAYDEPVTNESEWKLRMKAAQIYEEVNDWLLAQGISPNYNHKSQRYSR